MPPKTKSAEAGLKDIRAFFGSEKATPVPPGASQSSVKSKPTIALSGKSSKTNNPIVISDSDDAPEDKKARISQKVEASAPHAAQKRKSRVLISDDSDDGDVPPKKRAHTPHVPTPVRRATTSREALQPGPRPHRSSVARKKNINRIDSSDEGNDNDTLNPLSDDEASRPRAGPRSTATGARSRTEKFIESDVDTDEEIQKKRSRAPSKVVKPSKKVAAEKPKDVPPARKKFIPATTRGPPPAAGSKHVPDGHPHALAGLAFVFTGELSSFSRDEAIDLAKRFGGRVTTAPSGKTSYVVLGEGAGPKKLEDIKRLRLKTLDEDGFLKLIATREGQLDEKAKAKLQKEEQKLKDDAEEMAKREKTEQAKKSKPGVSSVSPSAQLWTTKYAPQTLKDICGNKGSVEKLQTWLRDWPKSLKSNFKKPGPNGSNVYRAVLITGSPGIGKTTTAHVVAKLEGYTPIELNASDARSKKLVENSTNISNASLDGWMHGSGEATTVAGVEINDRTVLIMDEVDGMSAGDRGGVGALNSLIKKTRIPIICIANDRRAQKLKPLLNTCFNMPFRKPEANAIRSRLMTIALREKLTLSPNVLDQLMQGANSDIRQVLNMMSTWKLSHSAMDFDQGKQLASVNEKHVIMTPYTVVDKLLGPYTFSRTSRETLNDKIDYYFHDHSFIPLFVQENYLKPTPARTRGSEGPELEMKRLELLDKAASAISDGDLVDAMIHGDQHWGLMPLHAVHSTVRPAFHIYGQGAGYGGKDGGISFPAWLGQNSKQGKLQRQLGEIQIRMRLKVSGDKNEIRQSYVPALFPHIVQPLIDNGASEVDDVIQRMDDYFLTKDEWDTVIEIGVDDFTQDLVLKKIATATKTSLTRKYNSTEHPIPFHKATDLGLKSKKIAKGEVPDQEDVFDEDEAEDEVDDDPGSDDDDISKDKLIKGKTAAKPRGKSKAVGKGKQGS